MYKRLETALDEREVEFFMCALATAGPAAGSTPPGSGLDAAATSRVVASGDLRDRLDTFRKAVTNLGTVPATIAEAKSALCAALHDAGCLDRVLASHADRMAAIAAARVQQQTASFSNKRCYTQTLMHEVVRGLFVGSYHPANDPALLAGAGVTHVLCCIDVKPRHPDRFRYLVLPASDADEYDMAQHFLVASRFIDEALASGGAVLVHCGAGISRAPTVVAAYLVRKLGVSAVDAVAMIQRVRQVASPNRGFMKQLVAFAAAPVLDR